MICQKLLDLLQLSPSPANFMGNISSSPPFDNLSDWVVDSGATDHLCHDRRLFSTFSPLSYDQKVTLPNGYIITIEGVVTCHLAEHLILHNVFFVPKFLMASFVFRDEMR
ncbi:hypothetical protein I3760_10G022500 [Carya illinoinensis]|nr:hypothetical protein I3760_10G022500 [Carya illinoinensis]